MRVKRRKTMALLAAVSIVCAQSTVSDVFAAGAEEVAAQENNAFQSNTLLYNQVKETIR